jgi:hypothetical protein
MTTRDDVTNVLAHGAWADGSSFEKVIRGLRAVGLSSVASPLRLTSLTQAVPALAQDRAGCRGLRPFPAPLAGRPWRSSLLYNTGARMLEAGLLNL